MDGSFEFKIATEQWEFEQIKQLNYETFVEEIPQHEVNSPDRSLTDRFHNENTYIICINGKTLVGMLAVRGKRPFSLDLKLKNLDSYLPEAKSICELRLLSIRKEYRYSRVFYGLLVTAAKYCERQGYDLAIMSGILKQQKLYRHLGFVPFGPVVGTDKAQFQPMYLTLKDYLRIVKPLIESKSSRLANFLPGPVEIIPEVRNSFSEMIISHRSQEYLELLTQTKQQLCKIVNSKYVEILMGSGTLANDVIAGQLSLITGKGLILSNGEFGNRLIEQAHRFNLNFETFSISWGRGFDRNSIEKFISNVPGIKWLWAVHCETSTGVLNNLEMLKQICRQNNILLCLDCVSSIGNTELDLQDVYLASGVSGKGLGAFSGLALVFYNHQLPKSAGKLPAYLDLALYAEKKGTPFTISSNLVYALHTALRSFNLKEKLENITIASRQLRNEIKRMGLNIIAPDEIASPFVITIQLPDIISSEQIGDHLYDEGFLVSYKSSYLLKRNWIQICLMGRFLQDDIERLLKVLKQKFVPHLHIAEIKSTGEHKKPATLADYSDVAQG